MTYILLISSVFYWIGFPIIGLILILISYIYNYDNSYVNKYIILILSAVWISYFIGSFRYSNLASGIDTIIHFSILLLALSKFEYKNFEDRLNKFLNIFIVGNFALYIVGITANIPSLFHVTSGGIYRFKSLFGEPSYLAIFISLLLFLQFLNRNRINYYSLIGGIILVLLTGSGSGLILLGLGFILLLDFRIHKKRLVAIGLVLLMGISAITFSYVSSNPLFNYIDSRAESVIEGRDRSAEIRFIAPVLLTDYALNEFPLLGTGFGKSDSYMLDNYSGFSYLIKYDESGKPIKNTNIDNGLAYLFFNTGVIGTLLIIYLLLKVGLKNKNSQNVKLKIYLILMLFFTGALIHPLFIGPFFLNKKKL